MSISLHLDEGQTQIPKHIERFDLESVFYVMFWEAQLSNKGELYATKAAKDEYKRWNGHDDKSLIAAKRTTLHDMASLNESYRPLLAQWLKPLGEMFDTGYRKLVECDDNCTVPVDLQRPAFDYDTLEAT